MLGEASIEARAKNAVEHVDHALSLVNHGNINIVQNCMAPASPTICHAVVALVAISLDQSTPNFSPNPPPTPAVSTLPHTYVLASLCTKYSPLLIPGYFFSASVLYVPGSASINASKFG